MFDKGFLQLFADGQGGPQGEATGVTDADAGHQKQEIRAQEGQAAAADDQEGLSLWQRIKADPEANRELQAIIQARLKTEQSAQAELSRLAPMLEALSQALESQSPPPAQIRFQRHLQALERQGEEFKARFPGFDLRKELQNPLFARLTAPHVGLSVEDAFFAVHRKALQSATMALTARRTAQKLSSAVAAGSLRPVENGICAQAPSVTGFDYRSMSPEQRKALKDRIRSGEKIFP